MIHNQKIAVVIPSYKVKKHIVSVIKKIPIEVDLILVVDDKCPEESGKYVEEHFNLTNKRVKVLYNEKNIGVGGAVKCGYKYGLYYGADILIKIDGDDQMDTKHIKNLVYSLITSNAGYVKGNRFTDFKALKSMPNIRLLGNSILSFVVKVCSGYWSMMDPTNGFTAIKSSVIKKIDLDKVSNRYFFEIDMLVNLNIIEVPIMDIPMPAIYGDEVSSLNISNVIKNFPKLLLNSFFKRIVLKYYIYSFNMFSIYMFFGFFMSLWGVVFGLYHWYIALKVQVETPTGTIMLSVLPLILGVQFILQAISIDIDSTPKVIEKKTYDC